MVCKNKGIVQEYSIEWKVTVNGGNPKIIVFRKGGQLAGKKF